jgi:hypothetical protein
VKISAPEGDTAAREPAYEGSRKANRRSARGKCSQRFAFCDKTEKWEDIWDIRGFMRAVKMKRRQYGVAG